MPVLQEITDDADTRMLGAYGLSGSLVTGVTTLHQNVRFTPESRHL